MLRAGSLSALLLLLSNACRQPPAPPLTPEDAIIDSDRAKTGDTDLLGQYQLINKDYFGGKLPAVPVIREPRLAELETSGHGRLGLCAMSGDRILILVRPDLEGADLRRTLCHEMVHAELFAGGDRTSNHGPAFQAELERIWKAGAFEGTLATAEEKADGRRQLAEARERLHALEARLDEMKKAFKGGRAEADQYNLAVMEYRTQVDAYNDAVANFNLMVQYPDGADEQESPAAAP